MNKLREDRHVCPSCSAIARKVPTLETLFDLATRNGGQVFAVSYIGMRAKYGWKCKNESHPVWNAAASDVAGKRKKKGTWCPYCSPSPPVTLKDAHKLAAARNGRCLSTIYINSKQKMLWQCEHGHKWPATYANVRGKPSKTGTWCPDCANEAKEKASE